MCVDFQSGLVAGGANDSVVRVWDVATERVRVRVHPKAPRARAIPLLLSCAQRPSTHLPSLFLSSNVDVRSPHFALQPPAALAPQTSLVGHSGKIYGVCLSPDNRQLVSTGTDRSIKVWDLARGVCTCCPFLSA